jgi:hypothetical protein
MVTLAGLMGVTGVGGGGGGGSGVTGSFFLQAMTDTRRMRRRRVFMASS